MAECGVNSTTETGRCCFTCSFFQRHQCHSWSTRYWVAGLMSWHSLAFSAFHTPGRAEPRPLALTWRQACTCCQIPHRNALPEPHQSLFLPVLGQKQWTVSGRCEDRAKRVKQQIGLLLILDMLTAVSSHLEFALIKGTHWCLVSRMAQVHKDNIPRFLLRSREILFIDPICQCNCRGKCAILLLLLIQHLLPKATFRNLQKPAKACAQTPPTIPTCSCLIHEPEAVETCDLSSIQHWSPLSIRVVGGNLSTNMTFL